jgi:cell filamentation protein
VLRGNLRSQKQDGVRRQDDLDEFELAMFLTRADEDWPSGDLDYGHYKALHRHLFQDVYRWAGKPRSLRIGKGGNWFWYPEYIDG